LVFEFQRADAVGDLLQRVFDGVRVGVHRVDAPLVAGVVVGGPAHAVQRGVAHVDVGAGHVDLRAQDGGAVGNLAVAHGAEALEVFRGRAGAEAAVGAGGVEVAAVRAHFVGGLLVHIGKAGADQVLGGFVHEVEVVAGEVLVRLQGAGGAGAVGQVGFVAEPLHRVADGVDVFLLFFFRVGVVKAQVAHAAVFLGQLEVEPDALGVADVQVAVGFGREAHAHLGGVGHALGVVGGVAGRAAPFAAGIGALCEVVLDHVAQEIARCSGRFGAVFVGRGGHWPHSRGRLPGVTFGNVLHIARCTPFAIAAFNTHMGGPHPDAALRNKESNIMSLHTFHLLQMGRRGCRGSRCIVCSHFGQRPQRRELVDRCRPAGRGGGRGRSGLLPGTGLLPAGPCVLRTAAAGLLPAAAAGVLPSGPGLLRPAGVLRSPLLRRWRLDTAVATAIATATGAKLPHQS
jgi:hypothetical protein